MFQQVWTWIGAYNWSVYSLLPSVTSIFVSTRATRSLKGSMESEIFREITHLALPRQIVNIAADWELKTNTLVGYILVFPSLLTAFKAQPKALVPTMVLWAIFGTIFLLLPVVNAPIGTLNEEVAAPDGSGFFRTWRANHEITDAKIYKWYLILIHSLLVLANLIALS